MPSASQAASAGIAVGAVAVIVTFGAWTAANVRLVPAPVSSTAQYQAEPVLDDSLRAGQTDGDQTGVGPAIASTARTKPDPVRSSVDAGAEPDSATPSSVMASSDGVSGSDTASGTGTGTGIVTGTSTGTTVQVTVPVTVDPTPPSNPPADCTTPPDPIPPECQTSPPDPTGTPEPTPSP